MPGNVVVVSYNIRGGRNVGGRANLADQLEILKSLNPDILALQEVDRDWGRSGSVDQCRYLADGLEMPAIYAPNLIGGWSPERKAAQYGVAILWRGHAVRSGGTALPGTPGRETRGFAWIEFERDGTRAIAISAHLGVSDPERSWQAEALSTWISRQAVPVILAGDFNMDPGSSEYETLAARANDITRRSNLLTFPSDNPSRQIDYVFATGKVKPISAETVNAAESDHLPVVVRMRF